MVADCAQISESNLERGKSPEGDFIAPLYQTLTSLAHRELLGKAESYIPLYMHIACTSIGVQAFVRQGNLPANLPANDIGEAINREHLLGQWTLDF